jgi:hypothetical protein
MCDGLLDFKLERNSPHKYMNPTNSNYEIEKNKIIKYE